MTRMTYILYFLLKRNAQIVKRLWARPGKPPWADMQQPGLSVYIDTQGQQVQGRKCRSTEDTIE